MVKEVIYFNEKEEFKEEWDKLKSKFKDIKFTMIENFDELPKKKMQIFVVPTSVRPYMEHKWEISKYKIPKSFTILVGPNRGYALSSYMNQHQNKFIKNDFIFINLGTNKKATLNAHQITNYALRKWLKN